MAIALKVDVPVGSGECAAPLAARARRRGRPAGPDRRGDAERRSRSSRSSRSAVLPGVKPGTALDFVVAINIPPLPLEPGRQYAWRLTIDGDSRDDWRLSFAVRSAADAP